MTAGTRICPIDSGRYGSEEMRAIFTDEARYRLFIRIEGVLADVQSRLGWIPRDAGRAIRERAESGQIAVHRVREIEAESRHEVMSVIQAFAESCGTAGRYVHYGPTSSDIIDTAIALQLKSAMALLEARMNALLGALADLAEEHKATRMIGRTHGQHALPVTFGFKVASWADEILRHLERLEQLGPRVRTGKMAGAVGSMAGFGGDGQRLQEATMRELGLHAPSITTQVVSRDRLAEFICWTAMVAASLDTVATSVRTLQRTEIAEVAEPFDEVAQIGSSTMPQKRNPVLSENVSGLSRIVRSLVVPALETIPLWDERDLTNSSVERFTLPQACIVLDEMLMKVLALIRDLVVDRERMAANLRLSMDAVMAEAVMLAMVAKGVDRREAYALARHASHVARRDHIPYGAALTQSPCVRALFTDDELRSVLDDPYLGACVTLVEDVVRRCRERLRGRGETITAGGVR